MPSGGDQLRDHADCRYCFGMDPQLASTIAQTNEALLVALNDAHQKLAADKVDPHLVDLIRSARELHSHLSEALIAAEPHADAHLRTLAAVMGERIALLVAAVEGIEGTDGRTVT
jgi:hypothetical protein